MKLGNNEEERLREEREREEECWRHKSGRRKERMMSGSSTESRLP